MNLHIVYYKPYAIQSLPNYPRCLFDDEVVLALGLNYLGLYYYWFNKLGVADLSLLPFIDAFGEINIDVRQNLSRHQQSAFWSTI